MPKTYLEIYSKNKVGAWLDRRMAGWTDTR